MPLPRIDDESDDPTQPTKLDTLLDTITGADGSLVPTETTAEGWKEGRTAAPVQDYTPKRFGPFVDTAMLELRRDVTAAILSSAGVGVELVKATDGSSQRESWRRFIVSTIQPMGRIIAEEATRKLETDIELSFERLRGSDTQSIARGLRQLTESGMSLADAMRVVGLEEE